MTAAPGQPLRILFVSAEPPDAPWTGSIIQTHHFVRLLAKEHTVGVCCIAGEAMAERVRSLHEFVRYCHVIAPPAIDRMRDRVAWIAGDDPMARWGYPSRAITPGVARAIEEFRPDVVQFEQLHIAHPLLALSRLERGVRPVLVYNAHDAVHVILERAYRAAAGIGARLSPAGWLNARFIRQVRRLEHRIAASADAVTCVSDVDARMLSLPRLAQQFFITPNGVDTDFYIPLPPKPRELPPTLVFVGNLSYGPNADAVRYYVERIHPLLRRRKPDLKLIVIGKVTPELEPLRSAGGLEFVGFQRDVRPFFERADASIVPLRAGSGTRFKILESWAMGRPVVSTTIGAEGLPFRHDENILIADDPESIARAVESVLDDIPLQSRLATRGRETVERGFSWNAIGAALDTALTSVTGRCSATPGSASGGEHARMIAARSPA